MIITDMAAAQSCLERIGYYRLSAYWYPFRQKNAVESYSSAVAEDADGDNFAPGTTFQQIMDLYVFDRQLRLLFLDALERVEVALRVDIALLLGARGGWAHRDPAHLHGKLQK